MKTNNLMERENTIMSDGTYAAPQVEVIEVAVEKGYAGSADMLSDFEDGGEV
ncbi:MAG: hypothetical protein IJ467_08645 [Bacteroidaceae bacterium]|nr:hypothetical protein [Bacteroidaceae bacterium]